MVVLYLVISWASYSIALSVIYYCSEHTDHTSHCSHLISTSASNSTLEAIITIN